MNAILHNKVLWIAMGGGAGSAARYLVASGVQRLSATLFPFGTMAVNVLGCLAIGFLMIRLEASVLAPHQRMAILVGFLGGFTTFSTFSAETLKLVEERALGYAACNVTVTLLACLTACWLGQRIARGMAG
ncbi:MAG: fluoride efflux transporter CrcB [Phycisphaerales bacterium]|nr:fluoride efflux transporter CrcB [Phycisphaerales bacterium]